MKPLRKKSNQLPDENSVFFWKNVESWDYHLIKISHTFAILFFNSLGITSSHAFGLTSQPNRHGSMSLHSLLNSNECRRALTKHVSTFWYPQIPHKSCDENKVKTKNDENVYHTSTLLIQKHRSCAIKG